MAARFLSVDPAEGNIADPQSLNRYAYVRNNPVRLVDPTGESFQDRVDAWMDAGANYMGITGILHSFTGNDAFHVSSITATTDMADYNSSYRHAASTYLAIDTIELAFGIGALKKSVRLAGGVKPFAKDFVGAKLNRAEQLRKNAIRGKQAELNFARANASNPATHLGEQITLVTDSGTRTRVDFLGRTHGATPSFCIIECKSSVTAPLTPNQRIAFPEIAESGATVVGKGKPGLEGGTRIPPTAVQVHRP